MSAPLCYIQFSTWPTQFCRRDIKYLKKLPKAKGGKNMLRVAMSFGNFPYHAALN